jgi:hypothetical protein
MILPHWLKAMTRRSHFQSLPVTSSHFQPLPADLSQLLADPTVRDNAHRKLSNSQSDSHYVAQTCTFVTPSESWNENQWDAWWEKFHCELFFSELRRISGCKDTAENLALIKNRSFPIFLLWHLADRHLFVTWSD